ncbi:MAG: polysaccharide-degrading enzyme [Deltaproteobacteria bacterium]|nr:MAG: polysaccharide-degrading enzyme [Deltaproteobacteria bacterium]
MMVKTGSKYTLSAIPLILLTCAVPVMAAEYRVGPGQALSELDEVPWESLAPGDLVEVYWRPEPYRSKIIIAVQATQQHPFTLRGVPGPNGELPVIDGRDATTRSGVNFWNEARGLLKIGGSNNPDCDPPACIPSWITVENLDLRSARPPYRFTGRNGQTDYAENAASVYVEVGQHIVIRNCRLHDSGNGLFIGVYQGNTQDILVEGNHIYDNGIEGSIYEHNSYTSARGIVFQFNHYGPLRAGCLGNNLKDRSAGLVVRYNWIENGNRQLDLVDGEDSPAVPNDPAYRSTFVYGNILVEAEGEGNSQIVHYGGDSGDTSIYRKGTLYFYHNTVISTRTSNTTLFRLSTNDEHLDARNNVFWARAGGQYLALLAGSGQAFVSHNWFNQGWRDSHGGLSGTITDDGTNIAGADPGFVNAASQDFTLAAGSDAIDAGGPLAGAAAAYPVEFEYIKHQQGVARPRTGAADLGAFEFCPGCTETDGGTGETDGGAVEDGGWVDESPGADEGSAGDGGADQDRAIGPDGQVSEGESGEDTGEDEGASTQDAGTPGDGDSAGGKLTGGCDCSNTGGGRGWFPFLLLLPAVVRQSRTRRRRRPGRSVPNTRR